MYILKVFILIDNIYDYSVIHTQFIKYVYI